MTKVQSYILDTSALIPLFKAETQLSSSELQQRGHAEALFARLDDEHLRLVVPAPVVYELLYVQATTNAVAQFLASPRIEVAPLTRSAAECAARIRRTSQPRQAFKFDACIAGIAISMGYRSIIAFDEFFEGIEKLARIDFPKLEPTQLLLGLSDTSES